MAKKMRATVMARVSFTIPEEDLEALDGVVDGTGQTRSEVIREAIKEWVYDIGRYED